MRFVTKTCLSTAVLAALMLAAAPADATPLYFQGFETGTSGWSGTVAQEPSGAGGITALNGSYYANVSNNEDSYQPGYGTGGFSFFEGDGLTPPPYPGSAFSESLSIYIDVATPSPSLPEAAFWVDMTPSSVTPDGVGCDPAACSDEHNFNLFYNGSSVSIGVDGSAPVYSITTSGWYTFQGTFAKGATPTDLVQTDMNILDSSGALLSSTALLANSDGSTLESSNLAGPGYIWLPVWQNGFSQDVLAIDNVRADTIGVPEPATLVLFGAGLGLLGFARHRRRAS